MHLNVRVLKFSFKNHVKITNYWLEINENILYFSSCIHSDKLFNTPPPLSLASGSLNGEG